MTETQFAAVGIMVGSAVAPWGGIWLSRKFVDPIMLEPRLQKLDSAAAERRRQWSKKVVKWNAIVWGVALFAIGLALFFR